jgi:hypothetical protein
MGGVLCRISFWVVLVLAHLGQAQTLKCDQAVASKLSSRSVLLSPRPIEKLKDESLFKISFFEQFFSDRGRYLELSAGEISYETGVYIRQHPKMDFTISDFRKSNIKVDPEIRHAQPKNLHLASVNNADPVLFPDNGFDGILMVRGLCNCNADEERTCGGLPINVEGLSSFFKEVARILNKKNPFAVAVLQGAYRKDEDSNGLKLVMIERALRILEKAYPDVQVSYIDKAGMYSGILLRPVSFRRR